MPPQGATRAKPRSIVYIDGFNFYYGVIRDGPFKWLNLQRFFEMIRQGDDIQQIKYFTALLSGPKRLNQKTYLSALETLPLVKIVLGKFKTKQVRCNLTCCSSQGPRFFASQEEKRTDVNIAIQMLDDAYQDRCDRLILVSGDSDLVPAINMVKTRFPRKEIIVYVPTRNATRGAATEIRSAADRDKTLPLKLLSHAQLPSTLPDGSGGVISKPESW